MRNTENAIEALRGVIRCNNLVEFYLRDIERSMEESLGQDKSCKKRRTDKCEIKFSANNWTTGDFIFNGKSYGFALDVGPYKTFIVKTLGEEAELEAQTFSLAQTPIGSTNVEFSTNPAFLPNVCYVPFLFTNLI